jgi:hypothetical protein
MHHAYFYEGPLSLLGELVASARILFNFEGGNNPDLQVREFEKFGIEDSQALRALASFKSTSGRALFVIGVGEITNEAQQALLKLFEEPAAGSIFVLLLPHGALLPTLRSRMLPYPEKLGEETAPKDKKRKSDTQEFLGQSYKTRSAAIAALLKDDEGVKERVRELLGGLETELYGQLQKTNGKKEYVEALEDIAKVRSYVGDRSPSLKMLLEHLAATLPQI